VLSDIARSWASEFAVNIWIYVNNWTAEYVTNPGARLDLLFDVIAPTTLKVVCLVLWSWTLGRALNVLSGRAVASNGVVLSGVVLAGTVGTTTIGMLTPTNAVVFSSGVYRVGIPLFARIALVILPFWRGAVGRERAGWSWTAVRAVATAILIGVSFKWITGAVFFGWVPSSISNNVRPGNVAFLATQFRASSIFLALLFPLALAWPSAYLLIQARRRHLAA
jgi:hypothetical protein